MIHARDGGKGKSLWETWLQLAGNEVKPHQNPALGQVFTPVPVARMMAAMLQGRTEAITLLDAGAGIGTLTAAAVEQFCLREPSERPKTIQVTAYEIDAALIETLRRTLDFCRMQCSEAHIGFSEDIVNRDFLEDSVERLTGGLFAGASQTGFNCVILNPPYRKIHASSRHRHLLRRLGIETGNLYTGFLAVAMRMLTPDGEIVAITPRSFCNGPYFKPFRLDMLQQLALDRLHVFESRQETFRADDVLQETIIFHTVKSTNLPDSVHISSSSGPNESDLRGHDIPYTDVVSPSDPDAFIHIRTEVCGQDVARVITGLPCSLSDLGLNVSTGRVVDFRARTYLRSEPTDGTVPLLYPAHLEHRRVIWPRARAKKPNSLIAVKETEMLLIPNAHYVLIRRFSTKEEKRRLVATVFEAGSVPGESVGFENHLNYFHCQGVGMDLSVARGLAAFLNSSLADQYFRQFNGHTQVNATDLRNFRYPSLSQLMSLGAKVKDTILEQEALDTLLAREIHAPSH